MLIFTETEHCRTGILFASPYSKKQGTWIIKKAAETRLLLAWSDKLRVQDPGFCRSKIASIFCL